MSHANVYRYFRSKTALLEAVTTAWLAPLEAGLRVIADAPDPVYDKLERLLFAIHRGYKTNWRPTRRFLISFTERRRCIRTSRVGISSASPKRCIASSRKAAPVALT